MRTGKKTEIVPGPASRRSCQLQVAGCQWPTTKDEGPGTKDQRASGFTLLELMVVITLIIVLASAIFPTYEVAVRRAREAVLRDDLFTMRKLIDQYTLDKQRPPQSLEELVDGGYLRGGVPEDPITRSNQTWQVDIEDVVISGSQAVPGIVDVHSGSDEISLDETPYNTW
ncbi:MAG: type II secretion system protein [Terriglobia bacterium]